MSERRPTLDAKDYVGLVAAVGLLSSYADDEPELYGTNGDRADAALTKIWQLLTPAEQQKVRDELGIE